MTTSAARQARCTHSSCKASVQEIWRRMAQFLVLLFTFVTFAGGQGSASSPRKVHTIHFVALIPDQHRYACAAPVVMPALRLAVENITSPHGLLHGQDVRLHFGNSNCSSAEAVNQLFNFYIEKKLHVVLGPCCDYAAAPVARQLHFWKLPMLTAGALARDFGDYKMEFFDFMTRIGATVNSMTDFLLKIIFTYDWKKIKLVYNRDGEIALGESICHVIIDGIHNILLPYKHIWQDYEKFEELPDFLDIMASEIADYASRSHYFFF